MRKKINKFLTIILFANFVFSCSKVDENKLVIPPNYSQLPDLNKKTNDKNIKEKDQDLKPLKEILLK